MVVLKTKRDFIQYKSIWHTEGAQLVVTFITVCVYERTRVSTVALFFSLVGSSNLVRGAALTLGSGFGSLNPLN